jgi:hypothetical protein
VIGHAQGAAVDATLDEIYRPAQLHAVGQCDGIATAVRIMRLVGSHTEAELGVGRLPGVPALGEMAQPIDEVGVEGSHFILPDAQDRRREIVVELRRDALERRDQDALGAGEIAHRERQRAGLAKRPHRLGLDAVHQLAARQRVEPLEGCDFSARREPLNGGEKEAVGTDGELFECRG